MKISWGIGISAVYILFVIVMVGTVIFSTTQETHLVADDYYEKEIAYQNQIEKIERTKLLSEQLKIYIKEELIFFEFPEEFESKTIHGSLIFYRPSDRSEDFILPIELNSENEQFISTSRFQKGMWRLQVEWGSGDNNYYNEQIIMIN
jgi:hypothetical protein